MSEERANPANNAQKVEAGPGAPKQPWATPTLTRMKAGSAEVGTQAANDGAFTTS